MIFTVEEENLICIFDISNQKKIINELSTALPDFDEPEMREIAENALRKLEKMSDEEFSEYIFSPVYDDEETED